MLGGHIRMADDEPGSGALEFPDCSSHTAASLGEAQNPETVFGDVENPVSASRFAPTVLSSSPLPRGMVKAGNVKESKLHLWIEKYDIEWVVVGYIGLFVFTVFLPFAFVFGVVSLLWVWWIAVVAVYLSTKGIKLSNHAHAVSDNHTKLLLMVAIVGVRYAIVGTILGEGPILGVSVSTIQLVLTTSIMALHPCSSTATAFIFLFMSWLQVVCKLILRSCVVMRVQFCAKIYFFFALIFWTPSSTAACFMWSSLFYF